MEMNNILLEEVWDVYSHNCPNSANAMLKRLHALDDHLLELEIRASNFAAKHAVSQSLLEAALDENAKLRELVCELWHHARLLDANEHIDGLRITSERAEEYRRRLAELGIEVGE